MKPYHREMRLYNQLIFLIRHFKIKNDYFKVINNHFKTKKLSF